MLLWFLNCSNITYTIPVMFLELLALEAAEQTDGIFHRNDIGGGLTVKPLLQCCSWSWAVLFFFYPMPENFHPSFRTSCTCSYTALGAYACVYSRYIYLWSLRNIWMTVCICEPANLRRWILTGVNLLLILMYLNTCHLCKAHVHNVMTLRKKKAGCQEKLTPCLVSVKQFKWLSHLRLK